MKLEKAEWKIIQKFHCQLFGKSKVKNCRDMVTDLVQSYNVMGCNIVFKGSLVRLSLRFFPRKIGGGGYRAMSTESDFTRIFPTMKSGAKANGVPVCWLTITGHLEETLHRQNGAESHSLLLFT